MIGFGNIRSWAKSNRIALLLLLIIFLGSFLRIYDLGTESIWHDEAASIDGCKQDLASVVQSSGRLHNQPPLYFILLHYWMLLFGTSEVAVRSLSAIFGILSILLIYKIGHQLFSKKVGLISCFLLAISSYNINYSQVARGYSLLLLLTLLSFFFFIEILKGDKQRKRHFALLLLSNLGLAYTHVYGLFVIMGQIFYFILFWNKYRQQRFWFCGTQVATIALFSPWIPIFIGRISALSYGFWIPKPSLSSIGFTIAASSGSGCGRFPLLMAFFLFGLLGFFSFRSLNGKWTWREPLQSIKGQSWSVSLDSVEEVLLLLIWFFSPILIPFAISKFFTPIYSTRYTISATAAMYLLAAKGISTFTRKKVLYSLVIVIALLSLPGLQHYYTHDVKQQWRETANFIESNSQANDIIFICSYNGQKPFDYYYEGHLKRFGVDRHVDEASEIVSAIDDAITQKERLWLVLWHARESPIRDYVMDRFGKDSIVLEKEFVAIEVYLFATS